MDLIVIRAETKTSFNDSLMIREAVFIVEQAIDRDVEIDQFDNLLNDQVVHYVGYLSDIPVCTCRVLLKDDGIAKIGRVAVLKQYRQQKIGSKMFFAIEAHLMANFPITKFFLESQSNVSAFYESLGYLKTSAI